MAAFIEDSQAMVPHNRMRYPPMVGYEASPERNGLILQYMLRETR
jgi:hypothetical protein